MLNYRHIPATDASSETALVFLHGIAGSQASWLPVFNCLAAHGHLLFIDCLGFGKSPRPALGYTVGDHLQALQATLDDWRNRQAGPAVKRIFLIGHSMGALLCTEWAQTMTNLQACKGQSLKPAANCESSATEQADDHPAQQTDEHAGEHAQLAGVVLVSMPLFTDEADAVESISHTSMFNRWMALETPLARVTCWMMCHLRPLLTPLMPHFLPELPPAVARDSLQHSWGSYSQTLKNVIIRSNGKALLEGLPNADTPVLVIHGKQDTVAPFHRMQTVIEQLGVQRAGMPFSFDAVDGGHDIVFTHPQEMAHAIEGFVSRVSGCYTAQNAR